ncbi:hypothetical protein LINGRAHAP2_LOCUS26588, partial [Linum grandiflorum]
MGVETHLCKKKKIQGPSTGSFQNRLLRLFKSIFGSRLTVMRMVQISPYNNKSITDFWLLKNIIKKKLTYDFCSVTTNYKLQTKTRRNNRSVYGFISIA